MAEKLAVTTDPITFSERDMSVWKWLISRGISNSITGLSRMIGQELNVNEFDVNHVVDTNAVDLLGGNENTVVGIHLTITGDATGHILLTHDSKVASSVIGQKMRLSPGSISELGQLELSFLGEMGNIFGAFFLNTLSDATNLHLSPLPPRVMIKSAEAVVKTILTHLLSQQDMVSTVRAKFGTNGRQAEGTVLIMPTLELMQSVLEHAKVT